MGCKKEGCTDPSATNYNPEAKTDNNTCEYYFESVTDSYYVPIFEEESATLVAIDRGRYKIYNKMAMNGLTGFKYGYIAAFTADNGKNFVSADTVTVTALKFNFSNHYSPQNLFPNNDNTYNPIKSQFDITSIIQINFVDTITWKAKGFTWPAFELTATKLIPSMNEINSSAPHLSSNYTLSTGMVSNADSVLFEIHGQNKKIQKLFPGNQLSCDFTTEELKSVGRGPAILKIIAIVYEKKILDGKIYNLLKEREEIKQVFIE